MMKSSLKGKGGTVERKREEEKEREGGEVWKDK